MSWVYLLDLQIPREKAIECGWTQTNQNWCQNVNFFVVLITFVYVVPFNGIWIIESCANMDIEKSKMSKKFFQYQSLVWTKDV
jgi:hypothetical protein